MSCCSSSVQNQMLTENLNETIHKYCIANLVNIARLAHSPFYHLC